MKLLDLFCGAGGAAYGYMLAGFHVTGIDINPQPRYRGDDFVQADALEYVAAHGHEFDVIHASPPCQRYSVQTAMRYRDNHPDLIAPTRELLRAAGKPYVIENVENARALLINPIKLCGSMFGLNLWRHRYFEMWPDVLCLTPICNHAELPVLITGTTRRKPEKGGRMEYSAQQCRDASGLHWMTRKEMDEAIPPIFTKWIGERLMKAVEANQ
jgi:DNA (cytosine-5)-methyltransferase 1